MKRSLPTMGGSTAEQDHQDMRAFASALAFTVPTLLVAFAGSAFARMADDAQLQRLALCQDSWLDWKDDAVRMSRLANCFETRFDRSASDAVFTPRLPTKMLGWSVSQVYPQSVGMGVGFALTVNADRARARAEIEEQLRRPMTCATTDGVRSCEVPLASGRTAVLMAEQNGRAPSSLVGCDYFYQQ